MKILLLIRSIKSYCAGWVRLSLFSFFTIQSTCSYAQPPQNELRILRIDTSGYPTIRIHLRVLCNGNLQKSINQVNLTIKDEDLYRQFTLQCPVETKPISVALALDRSSSVAGTSILMIKEGARQFFSYFTTHNTGTDEGAVISFADDVTIDQPMTTNKQALINAVNNLSLGSTTRLWEAAMEAIRQVAAAGTNQIKAILLLTDGYNNRGFATRDDVIALARSERIPVYAIGVTYEDSSQAVSDLKMIADSTGGKFFNILEPGQIIEAYNAIASILTNGLNDCVAEYQTSCSDGTARTVTVTVQACNTTLTKSMTYYAKLDNSLPSFMLSIGSASVYTNGRARIPVLISSGGNGVNIVDLRFRILTSPLTVFARYVSNRYFAKNFTVDQSMSRDTVLFHLYGSSYLSGSDTLMMLEFDAGMVQRDSTIPLPIVEFIRKIGGCQIPKTNDGSITILRRPILSIQCQDSLRVSWDHQAGDYSPSIVTVSASVTNPGPATSTNVRAKIILPYGLELAQGSLERILFPSILLSGQSAVARFQLKIIPGDSTRSLPICIETYSDSSAISRCCTEINLPAAKPLLTAKCSAPSDVRWDDQQRAFVPNPFTLTMDVTNQSVLTAKNIIAWIHAPPEFEIDPGTPVIQNITPSILRTSETGKVQWYLRALERPTSDTVEFCMKAAAGGDTVVCCVKMFITASPVRVMMQCTLPQIIKFNEDENKFEPGTFALSTTIMNTSQQPMTRVQARLVTSNIIGLAQGEVPIKSPQGQILMPGDTSKLTWSLVGVLAPISDSDRVCVVITADNFPGTQCCSVIRFIKTNTAPTLQCSVTAPDTIRFIQTAYQPNPITLRVHVENLGTSSAKNVFASLLQGADVSIDTNDVAFKLVADSLGANESRDVNFRLRILPRTKARIDTIRISLSAQNGGGVMCEKYIFIEAIQNPILSLSCSAPDSLQFDDATNDYLPTPFALNVTVRNTGTVDAINVRAEFLTASGFALAAGENAVKQITPSMLQSNQQGSAAWLIRAIPRTAFTTDTLRVRVSCDGGYQGGSAICFVKIVVPPVKKPNIIASCSIQTQIQVVQNTYQPEPLPVSLSFVNTGNASAYDVTAILLNNSKFTLASQDSAVKKIPTLDVNQQHRFVWMIHVLPSSAPDTASVCFRISDRFGNAQQCCALLIIPPLNLSQIEISCSSVDSVFTDPQTGEFQNPFVLSTRIKNISSVQIDSVRMSVILPSGFMLDVGETVDKTLYAIQPQTNRSLEWRINALSDTSTGTKTQTFRIIYYTPFGVMTCERKIVFIPGNQAQVSVMCTAPDTVKYINSTVGLQPSPFSVTIRLKNTGRIVLQNGQVTLDLPQGISLVSGEVLTKNISQTISPNEFVSVSWNVIPSLVTTEQKVQWTIHVQFSSLTNQSCTTQTIIEAVKQEVQLKIPADNIVQVGKSIDVPVYVTNPSSLDITAWDFTLEFDQRLISITGSKQAGTMTASWRPIYTQELRDGVVYFETSGSTSLEKNGVLCFITVSGISGDGTDNVFGIGKSPLRFQRAFVRAGVAINMIDGEITTTGSCAQPLNAGGRFALKQNQPNPLSAGSYGNPSTTIVYQIPKTVVAQKIELSVFDAFGRKVETLVDGIVEPGMYSVIFNARNLSSGVYFYQLRARGYSEMRKMVIAR